MKFYYEGRTATTVYATDGTKTYEYCVSYGGVQYAALSQAYLQSHCAECSFDQLAYINNAARIAFSHVRDIRNAL
jgi:hypothetical protein